MEIEPILGDMTCFAPATLLELSCFENTIAYPFFSTNKFVYLWKRQVSFGLPK